ncbi:MAG: hypothetical protein QXI84_09020 [Thermofilaceae archaeon]
MRKAAVIPLFLPAVLAVTLAAPQLTVILYGQEFCPVCARQKEALQELAARGAYIIYLDLSNRTVAAEFYNLYTRLVGDTPLVPFTLVCDGGKLVVVAVDYHAPQQLVELVEQARRRGEVLVSTPKGVRALTDREAVAEAERAIEARLSGVGLQPPGLTVSEVLPVLVSLAWVDSVKPCTFIVFATMLLGVAAVGGRRTALYASLGFIAAVYISYYLLGLGLVTAASTASPVLLKVVASAGLALGVYLAAANARGRLRSLVPRRLLKVALDTAERAPLQYAAVIGGAATGALVSVTLIPCAGGPLLVSAALLSRVPHLGTQLALLALYNVIFVAPLAAIAAASSWFLRHQLSERKLAYLQAVAGAALAITCLYMLLYF